VIAHSTASRPFERGRLDDAVKNLVQVKKGDLVTATYTEALAYEEGRPARCNHDRSS